MLAFYFPYNVNVTSIEEAEASIYYIDITVGSATKLSEYISAVHCITYPLDTY